MVSYLFFSFKILSNLPAIDTDVGLTLSRIDLVARERTNLQPKKMDVLVGAFLMIRFVSAGWLYLLHLDLWMYGEREGITLSNLFGCLDSFSRWSWRKNLSGTTKQWMARS
jgi:hypothetical protein